MTKVFSPKRLDELPDELRGPSQNQWGGQKTQRLRNYRGQSFGPASPCRTYTDEERRAWAAANGYKSL